MIRNIEQINEDLKMIEFKNKLSALCNEYNVDLYAHREMINIINQNIGDEYEFSEPACDLFINCAEYYTNISRRHREMTVSVMGNEVSNLKLERIEKNDDGFYGIYLDGVVDGKDSKLFLPKCELVNGETLHFESYPLNDEICSIVVYD